MTLVIFGQAVGVGKISSSHSLTSSFAAFFQFCAVQKNIKKLSLQESTFFSILGSLRASPDAIFDDFGVPKGCLGRHFHSLLLVPFSAAIFDHFLSENAKNKRMKKLVSYQFL